MENVYLVEIMNNVNHTHEQLCVTNARILDGYTFLGIFNSMSTNGVTVGLVKGRHRMQINCLGYDEYQGNAISYVEVK